MRYMQMNVYNIHKQNPVIWGLMLVCVSLDMFELWANAQNPEVLSRFACSVMPLAKLATPTVSHELLNFIDTQCLGVAKEPAPSITFYMLKTVLAFIAVVPSWMYWIRYYPNGSKVLMEKYVQMFRNGAGLWKRLWQVAIGF